MSAKNNCLWDVLTYGSAELRRKAVPVKAVTDEIREIVSCMLDTMYANHGLGLAAEQVGRNEAICVIDVPPDADTDVPAEILELNAKIKRPLILINPAISDKKGTQSGQEGCLSFPDIFVRVKRAMTVSVDYTDLDGNKCSLRAGGLLARAVQHELDHLNGILLVDRMTPVQKVAQAGRLKRIKSKTEKK